MSSNEALDKLLQIDTKRLVDYHNEIFDYGLPTVISCDVGLGDSSTVWINMPEFFETPRQHPKSYYADMPRQYGKSFNKSEGELTITLPKGSGDFLSTWWSNWLTPRDKVAYLMDDRPELFRKNTNEQILNRIHKSLIKWTDKVKFENRAERRAKKNES